MAARAVIGVDGGGTGTRAVILDEEGRQLGRAEGGPALAGRPEVPVDIDAVASTVKRAASVAGIDLPAAAICAGLAGVGRDRELAAVAAALAQRDLASATRVITDAEAAFFHAFGDGAGLLLIAGTGSMAMGRAEDGRAARAGGWGQLLGDEGSGWDVGLRALRAVANATDGRGKETEIAPRLSAHLELSAPEELIRWAAGADKRGIAELAPIVCEIAAAGDSVARDIVVAAAASLKSHVDALLVRLGPWSAAPGLALAGGLLAPGGSLRDAVIDAVSVCPCVLVDRCIEPALGAARLALRDLRGSG